MHAWWVWNSGRRRGAGAGQGSIHRQQNKDEETNDVDADVHLCVVDLCLLGDGRQSLGTLSCCDVVRPCDAVGHGPAWRERVRLQPLHRPTSATSPGGNNAGDRVREPGGQAWVGVMVQQAMLAGAGCGAWQGMRRVPGGERLRQQALRLTQNRQHMVQMPSSCLVMHQQDRSMDRGS